MNSEDVVHKLDQCVDPRLDIEFYPILHIEFYPEFDILDYLF